jgi:hypothetical protein
MGDMPEGRGGMPMLFTDDLADPVPAANVGSLMAEAGMVTLARAPSEYRKGRGGLH